MKVNLNKLPGKRVKIILNPAANHGKTRQKIHLVEEFFKDRLSFNLELTTSSHHATQIAENLNQFGLVIVVGGDGTVHEVVNGLIASNNQRTALAVVPSGSGNDYQRTLNISSDFLKALEQSITGKLKQVDVGKVNEVYFVNSLGIGFDAQAAHKANQIKNEVKKSGISLYLTALFNTLFKEYSTYRLTIDIDNTGWQEKEIVLVAINIGICYGGGFKITPHAVCDDGLLDICLVDELKTYQIIPRLPFVIFGKHEWMKPVHSYQAKRISIKSDQVLPAHLDGELIRSKNFEIEIVPKRLRVITPD